ncbi:MAG: DUF1015 domain-containing protein [Propionibacteriaceae bacterium]|jgi:uncharacterized protein (DUF1015 family)|nr:DUF1015 domain-containing protein [Propionibacteriaceae bacterium]
MPDFRPFPALRYASNTDLDAVLAPPYDVLTSDDVRRLHDRDPYNITHVDVPDDYDHAAETLWQWIGEGVLRSDETDTFTIYRMKFADATGTDRTIVGVLGGLAVLDPPTGADRVPGATTVLPHERTTPKAATDRLELMRATAANTSPVWGLSLASGLTDALREPGEPLGTVEVDGVTHSVERVSEPSRIAAIRAVLAADDVLIADGHHRYAVSRIYRDEVRSATGRADTLAEHTLTFVNELVDDQLSISAIHRLYAGVTTAELRAALAESFELTPAPPATPALLAEMVKSGRLVALWPDGSAEWLAPRPGVFEHARALDGVWLETALAGTPVGVTYEHDLGEISKRVVSGDLAGAVLIRPTSIEEIRRTAREGLLMPPKSTFFTPKLLTGWVLRPTQALMTA